MGNLTIRILAHKLQLSAATVSKALTDSHEISAQTKKRVLDLAAELNYIPNPYASSLRRKKSKTIAVILPEVADSFFAQAIDGIEAVAQDKGYHVLICLTHERVDREQAILRDLLGGRADGILLSVTAETSDPATMQEVQAKGIPLVFFDRICESVEAARITTNDMDSAYAATEHLIRSGCRRIVILSLTKDLSISHQRIEGYKKALTDNRLRFRPSDIVVCEGDSAANQRSLHKLMESPNRPHGVIRPDGVIATVEKLTTSIYQVCQDLRLVIPDEVKIVGFSNLPSAMLLRPSLTTVTQPAFEMGKAAASLLFKALAGKNFQLSPQSSMVIPSLLQIRQSTGGEGGKG